MYYCPYRSEVKTSSGAGTIILGKARVILLLLLALAVAGCNSMSVAGNIDQAQANEIISLLHTNGISAVAEKETGGRGQFNVVVRKQQYSEAVTLLAKNGYPREPRKSFSELIAQRGMIPASREVEALRLDHALAVEIAELLQNHPGVSSARAAVRSNFVNEEALPSIAVVIQSKGDTPPEAQEIMEIVSRLVPGVKPDGVKITIGDAAPTALTNSNEGVFNDSGHVYRAPLIPFIFWRVPEQDYQGLMLLFIGVIVATGLAGYFMGYWSSSARSARHDTGELVEGAAKALRIERGRKNLPEG